MTAMRRDMVMAVDTPRPTTAAITVAMAAATAMVTHRLTMAADTGPTTAGRMSAACIVRRTLTIRVLGTTVATGTAGDRVAGDRGYERAAERGGPFLELHNRSRQSISRTTLKPTRRPRQRSGGGPARFAAA